MKKLLNIILYFPLLISCNQNKMETWEVTDFKEPHTFKIEIEQDKSVSNANIYLDGAFTDTIYLSTVEGDSTMSFTNEDMPTGRIFTDFYGGEFNLYMPSSNAQGHLKIRAEIPVGK